MRGGKWNRPSPTGPARRGLDDRPRKDSNTGCRVGRGRSGVCKNGKSNVSTCPQEPFPEQPFPPPPPQEACRTSLSHHSVREDTWPRPVEQSRKGTSTNLQDLFGWC